MLSQPASTNLTALFYLVVTMSTAAAAQNEIPRTWEDAAMATLEVPMADPVGSPKHVSAKYYYRIPVRPIYKSYPL